MSLSRNRSHAAESHQEVRNSSIDPWEEAYLQFETPEDEIRKFTGRLRRLGVSAWPKDTQVIELFCGRGNGLRAWEKLGFRNLEGRTGEMLCGRLPTFAILGREQGCGRSTGGTAPSQPAS